MRCKFKFGVVLRHRGRQEIVDWPEFVAQQKKVAARVPKNHGNNKTRKNKHNKV